MKPKNIWKKAWGAVLALTMSAGLLADYERRTAGRLRFFRGGGQPG